MLGSRGEQHVACLHQCLVALAAAVLQEHVESAEAAKTADRRQVGDEYHGVLDLAEQLALHARNQCRHVVLALAPWLEADEGHADILAGADKAESGQREHALDFRVGANRGSDLIHHGVGARDRGTGR